MPTIKWDPFFEDTYNTESTITLACVSGACDKQFKNAYSAKIVIFQKIYSLVIQAINYVHYY